jgi:RimJ/RimL family protein N-acetyltransferase
MYIETDRMILRNFAKDDLADLHEIFGDPIVMEHTEPAYNLEKTKDFLHDFCMGGKRPGQLPGAFAATLKDGGKVIGYVLFKEYEAPEIYEIGWIFNKDYWRKGYAYEICHGLIKYAFENMGLHKICAHATDGIKSVSIMEKLGMVQEGLLRKHSKAHDGRSWLDLYCYAILREDYYKSKESMTYANFGH